MSDMYKEDSSEKPQIRESFNNRDSDELQPAYSDGESLQLNFPQESANKLSATKFGAKLSLIFIGSILTFFTCWILYAIWYFGASTGGMYFLKQNSAILFQNSFGAGSTGGFYSLLGMTSFYAFIAVGRKKVRNLGFFAVLLTYLLAVLLNFGYNCVFFKILIGRALNIAYVFETCIKPAFTIFGSLAIIGAIVSLAYAKLLGISSNLDFDSIKSKSTVWTAFRSAFLISLIWFALSSRSSFYTTGLIQSASFILMVHVLPISLISAGIVWIILHTSSTNEN